MKKKVISIRHRTKREIKRVELKYDEFARLFFWPVIITVIPPPSSTKIRDVNTRTTINWFLITELVPGLSTSNVRVDLE